MSQNVEVFVRTEQQIGPFVRDLERQLGIKFTLLRDQGNESYYEYRNEQVWIGVTSTWGFENDQDLNLADYHYYLSIGIVRRLGDPQQFMRERDQFARWMFEQLKATDQYALLMVFDMQHKLDEFDPVHVPVSNHLP